MTLADIAQFLTDEVRNDLAVRRPPYRLYISAINLDDKHLSIPAGESTEVKIVVNPFEVLILGEARCDLGAYNRTGQVNVLEA